MDFCSSFTHCYNYVKIELGNQNMKAKSIRTKILTTIVVISLLVFSFIAFYLHFYARHENEKKCIVFNTSKCGN